VICEEYNPLLTDALDEDDAVTGRVEVLGA